MLRLNLIDASELALELELVTLKMMVSLTVK